MDQEYNSNQIIRRMNKYDLYKDECVRCFTENVILYSDKIDR